MIEIKSEMTKNILKLPHKPGINWIKFSSRIGAQIEDNSAEEKVIKFYFLHICVL